MIITHRLGRFARIALGSALLVVSAAAPAQNAVRGKLLYESKINPNYLSCSDANACHGANPLSNMNKVRNGANPQSILNALGSVPLMNPIRGLVSSTDAADIAAYIANPSAAATTSLTASAMSLVFGSTQVGAQNANPAPASVTITNSSAGSVTISGVARTGTNAGDFAAGGTCSSGSPVVLAAGGSCTLSATFTPSASGTRTATLTVQSTATTNPSITLSGTGSAMAVATINVSRTSIDFATQTVATTSTAQDLVVRNTGTAPLTITQVAATPNPEFTSTSNCVTSIVPGGSCTAVLVFTPAAAGARSGSLTITANTGTTAIPLAGNSVLVPTPIATAARTSLALPPVVVGTAAASTSVTFANTGNAPLEVTAVSLQGPDAKEFKFGSATTCKAGTMAPQAECLVELAFQPQSGGGKAASINVAHNASGGATVISVSATATVTKASSGSSALFPSNVGGAGALSLPQLALLALVLLLVACHRRRGSPRRAPAVSAKAQPPSRFADRS